jgi:beta-lactamase superfamily II metal-dependent hydrolase
VTASKEDTATYKNYVRERDDEIANGAKHYTAAECIEDESINGKFDLGDGITLTVLDSYFYYNRADNENDHSVCTLIDDGKNSYLFTGDLELEGEEKLVEMNDLPKVKLYKAGHHGSKTSSNDVLLSVIQPEIVCVCCCAGSPEYTEINANQFPTQAAIDRIAPYTDKIYVTTLYEESEKNGYTSMNGNIVVRSVDGEVSVHCSNNDLILKDTEWFIANRTLPKEWKKTK